MGQTAEDIRDNIVKIANEDGECTGTGFFIHKEYCITCHHNICGLNEIYVEREEDDVETGQQIKRRYPAEWIEEFSDMRKDVAFLKVHSTDLKPLEYRRETYGSIRVVVRGFPLQDLYNFPDGKDELGTLRQVSERFRWKEEEVVVAEEVEDKKKKKWNIKPEVNAQVYAFDGKFYVGFSGAPVCYEPDWKIVGMFEAKDDNQGYIIPMNIVVDRFDLEKRRKVSAPLATINAEKIIDTGNEYYNKKEYSKALEQYEIILNDPNYASALINKGMVLGDLHRYEEAIRCYDKALEINPNLDFVWFNKGYALYNLLKYKEAIRCYDKALEINPIYANAWYNTGYTLYTVGKYEEAIRCYDKALEINPNLDFVWFNKGNALSKLDRYEEAIRCYDKALEINPNLDFVWNYKGYILYTVGKYEEAIKCYDQLTAINPKDEGTWYFRARCKVKKGDIEGGLADLKRAVEFDKSLIQSAKEQEDFESIRKNKKFKALIMK